MGFSVVGLAHLDGDAQQHAGQDDEHLVRVLVRLRLRVLATVRVRVRVRMTSTVTIEVRP